MLPVTKSMKFEQGMNLDDAHKIFLSFTQITFLRTNDTVKFSYA